MAIITLRQLLHRPAPGGPISANDPLPVRLYGPNGQPISQQTPLDVRDQQLRDFLGSVHDEESDALKVALTGSNVKREQIASNLSVAAGAAVPIATVTLDCEKYAIGVQCVSGVKRWKIVEIVLIGGSVPRGGGSISTPAVNPHIIDHSATPASSNQVLRDTVGLRTSFVVVNHESEELVFNVWIERINSGRVVD